MLRYSWTFVWEASITHCIVIFSRWMSRISQKLKRRLESIGANAVYDYTNYESWISMHKLKTIQRLLYGSSKTRQIEKSCFDHVATVSLEHHKIVNLFAKSVWRILEKINDHHNASFLTSVLKKWTGQNWWVME